MTGPLKVAKFSQDFSSARISVQSSLERVRINGSRRSLFMSE